MTTYSAINKLAPLGVHSIRHGDASDKKFKNIHTLFRFSYPITHNNIHIT